MKNIKNNLKIKFSIPYCSENVSIQLLRILEPRQHLKTSFFITFDSYWASSLLRFEIRIPPILEWYRVDISARYLISRIKSGLISQKILAALTFFSGNILSIGQKSWIVLFFSVKRPNMDSKIAVCKNPTSYLIISEKSQK